MGDSTETQLATPTKRSVRNLNISPKKNYPRTRAFSLADGPKERHRFKPRSISFCDGDHKYTIEMGSKRSNRDRTGSIGKRPYSHLDRRYNAALCFQRALFASKERPRVSTAPTRRGADSDEHREQGVGPAAIGARVL